MACCVGACASRSNSVDGTVNSLKMAYQFCCHTSRLLSAYSQCSLQRTVYADGARLPVIAQYETVHTRMQAEGALFVKCVCARMPHAVSKTTRLCATGTVRVCWTLAEPRRE